MILTVRSKEIKVRIPYHDIKQEAYTSDGTKIGTVIPLARFSSSKPDDIEKLTTFIRYYVAPPYAKEQIQAFEKIYNALRDGQSSWIKTNYLSKITDEERKNPSVLFHKIKDYAIKNRNSRTGVAFYLMQKYFDKNTKTLKDIPNLEAHIYQWSFLNSGWFKMSKATGQTFFSSTSLINSFDEGAAAITPEDQKPAPKNSRLDKIRKALR